MEYRKEMITVSTPGCPEPVLKEVQATIGIGTGLAYNYWQPVSAYALTHVQSGYSLMQFNMAPSEQVAQRWLQKMAPLIDWTADIDSVKAQAINKYKSEQGMSAAIQQAFSEACHEAATPVEA